MGDEPKSGTDSAAPDNTSDGGAQAKDTWVQTVFNVNMSPAPASEAGGMTRVTADGAPISTQRNDGSDGGASSTAPAGGSGEMTGLTPGGAPFSAQGNDGSTGSQTA